MTGLRLTVEQVNLQQVREALKSVENGRTLQRVLNVQLKAAADPIVTDMKRAINNAPLRAAVRQTSTTMATCAVQPLRAAIADATKAKVSYAGKSTGVSIGVGRDMPRGFKMAGKRFNAPSFRHPVYGRGGWAAQIGAPGWFDNNTLKNEAEARGKVLAAIAEWSDALAVTMNVR